MAVIIFSRLSGLYGFTGYGVINVTCQINHMQIHKLGDKLVPRAASLRTLSYSMSAYSFS